MSDRLFKLEQEIQRLKQQAQQGLSAAQAYEDTPQTNRLLALEQSLANAYGIDGFDLTSEDGKSGAHPALAMQMAILELQENEIQKIINILDKWNQKGTTREAREQVINRINPVLENEKLRNIDEITVQVPQSMFGTVFKPDIKTWIIGDNRNSYRIETVPGDNTKLDIRSELATIPTNQLYRLPQESTPSSTQPRQSQKTEVAPTIKLPNLVGSINHTNLKACVDFLEKTPLFDTLQYVINGLLLRLGLEKLTGSVQTRRLNMPNVWQLQGSNNTTYYARLTDRTIEIYTDLPQNHSNEVQITVTPPGSEIRENVVYLPWQEEGFAKAARLMQYHLPNMHPITLTGGSRTPLALVHPQAKVYIIIHGVQVFPTVSASKKQYDAKELALRLQQDGLRKNHREVELLVCWGAQSIHQDTWKKAEELKKQINSKPSEEQKQKIKQQIEQLPEPADFKFDPNQIPPFAALLVQELKNLKYTNIRVTGYMGCVLIGTFTCKEAFSSNQKDYEPGNGQIWIERNKKDVPAEQFKKFWL